MPPEEQAPREAARLEAFSLAKPWAEAGAPGLGRGEAGAAGLTAKPSPNQAPTRPGRRGRERGPAAWRADRGRPGYPVGPEGAVHWGLQPGLVPGPRAGPHNSPCPRRLEIKRLTRRLCPSRSDKQFQVRSWAVEEGGDFQVAEISRRELGGASPSHPPAESWPRPLLDLSVGVFSHVECPCPSSACFPRRLGYGGGAVLDPLKLMGPGKAKIPSGLRVKQNGTPTVPSYYLLFCSLRRPNPHGLYGDTFWEVSTKRAPSPK